MKLIALLAVVAIAAAGRAGASPLSPSQVNVVSVSRPGVPVVDVRLVVYSGSAEDPAGREGLASFTGNLMRRGAEGRGREEIEESLDSIAGSLDVAVGKDTIVFAGRTLVQNFDAWYDLFRDVVLKPAFEKQEIEKLRLDQLDAIEAVRQSDEALAREGLDRLLYRNHPYGHLDVGRAGSIATFTREEILDFYHRQFVKGNVAIGLAGEVTPAMADRVRADFAALPDGDPPRASRADTLLPRRRVLVIEKAGREQVQIRIGHPISVTRAHADYYPLRVACAYLGEHREQLGRLYREIRMSRGLSYGAYAYIEYFAGMTGAIKLPLPNVVRREEAFSMWVYPKAVNAKIAIKLAVAEMQDLVANGVPGESLEEVKSFVRNHHAFEVETADRAMASSLDEILEGAAGFEGRYAKSVEAVTAESVAAAVRKHLRPERLGIAVVVSDAAAFIDGMLSAETPIEYPSGVGRDATRSRDLEIVGMDLGLKREDFEVEKASDLFR